MLDIGEREFLSYRPDAIFITHLHSDHAYFMSGEKIETTIPTYAPEASERRNALRVISAPIHIGSFSITPIPVVHSVRVKSVGYLVDKKRIFYSGDIATMEPAYIRRIKKVDMIITEASFVRHGE